MKFYFPSFPQWVKDRKKRGRSQEWHRVFLWVPKRNTVECKALGIDPRNLYWGPTMRTWVIHPVSYDRHIYATIGDVAAAKLKYPDATAKDFIRTEL